MCRFSLKVSCLREHKNNCFAGCNYEQIGKTRFSFKRMRPASLSELQGAKYWSLTQTLQRAAGCPRQWWKLFDGSERVGGRTVILLKCTSPMQSLCWMTLVLHLLHFHLKQHHAPNSAECFFTPKQTRGPNTSKKWSRRWSAVGEYQKKSAF